MGATPVEAWWSGRADGDQRTVDTATLPGPVPAGLSLYRLRQVHGGDVVIVDGPPPPGFSSWAAAPDGRAPEADAPEAAAPDGRAPEADAVVAVGTGSCLTVLTADCAPVALGSPEGIHGAVHVGWRGLVAGVIDRAVAAMTALGATAVVAGLGPTIHPCCYAFGPRQLDAVAAVAGDGVRSVTSEGDPALDLPAAVRARLAAVDVQVVVDVDECTGCGGDGFSFRARGDDARQALFVWRVAGAGAR